MKNIIQKAIEKAGGQAAVAAAMQITPQTVRQWELGERPVPPLRAKQLSDLCDGEPRAGDLNPKFAELFSNQ
jgi:DNA-binding transcriptional regulator YdaS (Cro superfamily)